KTGINIETNNKFAEITGRSREVLTRTSWMEITHPDDLDADNNLMNELLEGKRDFFSMKKRYLKPDGSPVWVKMSVVLIKIDEQETGHHLCMIEDIGEQVASQQGPPVTAEGFLAKDAREVDDGAAYFDRRQQAHTAILEGEPDDGLAVYLAALSFARHGVQIPPGLLGKIGVWMHTSKGARDAVVVLLTGGTYHEATTLVHGGLTWEADQAASQAMEAVLDEDRGVTPTLTVLDHARLLARVIAAVPVEYQVAPRTLLGLISYWAGDGALADRHLEEALKVDPTYTFAAQIRALQALGCPPGWVQRTLAA
ncbi:MAG: PAS domain S-box protein, partial [Opitutae bacterium]|nr:PAS domain S-box protein [Opitutae bacterium]